MSEQEVYSMADQAASMGGSDLMALSVEDLDRRLAAKKARQDAELRVEPDIEGRDIGMTGNGVLHLANGQQAEIL